MEKEKAMKLKRIADFLKTERKKAKEEKYYKNSYGGTIIMELFTSLRDTLDSAIKTKYGKKSWASDFSDSEVIFHKYSSDGSMEYDEEGEAIYYKATYEIKNGEAILTSDPIVVKRITNYVESILSFQAFMNMAVYQMEIKKNG